MEAAFHLCPLLPSRESPRCGAAALEQRRTPSWGQAILSTFDKSCCCWLCFWRRKATSFQRALFSLEARNRKRQVGESDRLPRVETFARRFGLLHLRKGGDVWKQEETNQFSIPRDPEWKRRCHTFTGLSLGFWRGKKRLFWNDVRKGYT